MRKLYMIRLENGNSVILQADTEEQALQDAGLRIDPTDRAALTGQSDLCETHLQLVRQGYGPQNYTIRELQDFMCVTEYPVCRVADFEQWKKRLTSNPWKDFFEIRQELSFNPAGR